MAKTPNKLSDTARAMLTLAATREDRLVRPPTLPAAARLQVVRSLLNNGLVEEVPAPIEDAAYTWRAGDDGMVLILRATDAGLAAVGVTPVAAEPQQTIEAFTQVVIGTGSCLFYDGNSARLPGSLFENNSTLLPLVHYSPI